MVFSKRLAELRSKNKMTQQELADKIGVSRGTIGMYEIGKRDPDTDTLIKIAKVFNVTTDHLLGNTPTPADKISDSVSDDPELAKFWDELKEREDLQLLFKQTREMSPVDIKKIIRIIKAIEDEEAADDDL
jgi:transcriptional regulator with XRE-family HTH domain